MPWDVHTELQSKAWRQETSLKSEGNTKADVNTSTMTYKPIWTVRANSSCLTEDALPTVMNSLLLRDTTDSDYKNHTLCGQNQVVRRVTDGL